MSDIIIAQVLGELTNGEIPSRQDQVCRQTLWRRQRKLAARLNASRARAGSVSTEQEPKVVAMPRQLLVQGSPMSESRETWISDSEIQVACQQWPRIQKKHKVMLENKVLTSGMAPLNHFLNSDYSVVVLAAGEH